MTPRTVYLVRCNGALLKIFTSEPRAIEFMKTTRKNGEFWRIQPHEVSE